MNVSAIIVTRGDQELTPVLDSLPDEWEWLIWNNGYETLEVWSPGAGPMTVSEHDVSDLSVYGRYAAIEYASGDLIYAQDDDCVVSDPQAIVDALLPLLPEVGWIGSPPSELFLSTFEWPVVCNMPQEFRHEFYEDHALVGFGACFHRDAPERAFSRIPTEWRSEPHFQRTCDIVFTALTPRVLVDVPYENLPWASSPNRMWMQPGHVLERQAMLDAVKNLVHA